MVNGVDASRATYETSRVYVVAFALGGFLLTLALGYAISWSIVAPVQEIDERLNRIAAGDFSQKVVVANRDELGALAQHVNSACEAPTGALPAPPGRQPAQVAVPGQHEP